VEKEADDPELETRVRDWQKRVTEQVSRLTKVRVSVPAAVRSHIESTLERHEQSLTAAIASSEQAIVGANTALPPVPPKEEWERLIATNEETVAIVRELADRLPSAIQATKEVTAVVEVRSMHTHILCAPHNASAQRFRFSLYFLVGLVAQKLGKSQPKPTAAAASAGAAPITSPPTRGRGRSKKN
jgi:hypothetical protein